MKFFKYLSYILRHKYYVMLECFKMGLTWRGLTHDLSKLLPDEWCPYSKYFYGQKGKSKEKIEKIERDFDAAWCRHQKRNKHHWQYWVLMNDDGTTRALKMPEKYVKEMVCDWRGASRAIIGEDRTIRWYGQNKDKMKLELSTRKLVESLLERSEVK